MWLLVQWILEYIFVVVAIGLIGLVLAVCLVVRLVRKRRDRERLNLV